ncbi:MAG: hypothetical protein FWG75_08850 [Cystobacterineae bacterium]|nr:hypothetical protein [Cystobacterineae bacterium]
MAQASCPSHAEMPATDACQRCGGFTCLQCKQLHPSLCPRCTSRQVVHTSFSFNRNNLQLLDLLSATWKLAFGPHWVELSTGALLASFLPLVGFLPLVVGVILQGIMGEQPDSAALMVVIMLSLALVSYFLFYLLLISSLRGLCEMAHMAWNGTKPTFRPLFNFRTGLKASVAFFSPVILFIVVFSAIGFIAGFVEHASGNALPPLPQLPLPIVLVVFALLIALGIALMPFVFVLQPFAEKQETGIGAAIGQCFRHVKGFRGKTFLLLLVCWVILMFAYLAGVLACGIGILLTTPAGIAFIQAYQAGFWKAISTPGTGDMPGSSDPKGNMPSTSDMPGSPSSGYNPFSHGRLP